MRGRRRLRRRGQLARVGGVLAASSVSRSSAFESTCVRSANSIVITPRCSTSRIVTPCVADLAERLEERLDDRRREPERRLVEQEHVGARDERARDRELLLLAAGERSRVAAARTRRRPGRARAPSRDRRRRRPCCAARRARVAGSRRPSATPKMWRPSGTSATPARAMSSGVPRSGAAARAGSRRRRAGRRP